MGFESVSPIAISPTGPAQLLQAIANTPHNPGTIRDILPVARHRFLIVYPVPFMFKPDNTKHVPIYTFNRQLSPTTMSIQGDFGYSRGCGRRNCSRSWKDYFSYFPLFPLRSTMLLKTHIK